jgi:M6 family metalloprotease-like protein
MDLTHGAVLRTAVLLMLAAVLGHHGGPLDAQQLPRAELGRFEVQGLDFRRDGGWRKRADLVRQRRRDLLRGGNLSALNQGALAPSFARAADASGSVLTGTFSVPVATIAYSNVAVPYPTDDFQRILFSESSEAGRPYTLKTYYEELSNGLIRVEGVVFDPVRMDTTDIYDQDGCNGIGVTNTCPNGGKRFGSMLLAVLDAISNRPGSDTLWGRFDNDGLDGRPNSGDDDGVVDVMAFLHPTADGACGQPGIWSHRYVIAGWNNGSAYVTKTPRRDTGGNILPGAFITIDDYTIQSQLGGLSGCDGTAIMPVGTIAHETGHVFGLPDLYDTDQSSRTEGIGEWGLMGSGNFARAYSPASYDAWSLTEMGWVTLRELIQDQTVTTGARQLSDTVFLARTTTPSQYFLIENRQAVQSDSAQMNPTFPKKKSPGLLLWLIDTDRIAQGRSSNRINTGSVQGIALVQADGLNQLRTPGSRNRGDAGDAYPGSTGNTRLGFATNPSSRDNFNGYAGFAIDRIEPLGGGTMRFRYLRREPSQFLAARSGVTIQVNGQSGNRYEEVFPSGETVSLAADTVQTVTGGRTIARFLAWSNGGARIQQLISGTRPDTVVASFTAAHRVQVTPQGGGTATASVQGDLAVGVFVEEGSAVTLTAATQQGLLFLGWQGDTLATDPTLRLPMQRPYDVFAVWLPEQQVPIPDATDDLLGAPKLAQSQRDYLDLLGNRNGSYDLGDYLAMLRRAGVNPSPELLARVAAQKRGNR